MGNIIPEPRKHMQMGESEKSKKVEVLKRKFCEVKEKNKI